jgi:methylated-DNA-protein-cysteine methyltransferase related protein
VADFETLVYEIARRVPPGRVTTYGTIARLAGHPRAARRVGWAMHRCPDDVPAHRVVNSQGRLSGGWAFGAPEVQRALLEASPQGAAHDPDGPRRSRPISRKRDDRREKASPIRTAHVT